METIGDLFTWNGATDQLSNKIVPLFDFSNPLQYNSGKLTIPQKLINAIGFRIHSDVAIIMNIYHEVFVKARMGLKKIQLSIGFSKEESINLAFEGHFVRRKIWDSWHTFP